MSYAAKIIGPDERLIGVARLHWIYTVHGFLWFLGLSVLGMVVDKYLWEYFGSSIPAYGWFIDGFGFTAENTGVTWMFAGGGAIIFLLYYIKVISSEIALTSRRVIYKKGLIFVEVEEIELEEVKGEHINHGLLGRVFNYGTLHFDCRFIGHIYLPAVRKPYRFMKAMHVARSKLTDGVTYAVATDGGKKFRVLHGERDDEGPDENTG